MPTVAILPIKRFDAAKQRLLPGVSAGQRRLLVEAMLSDVLVALRRAAMLDATVAVTSDNDAQRIAGAYGALPISDDGGGHNGAALRGIRYALERGFERALLVPGDTPVLDPAEVDALLERRVRAKSALVVPDRHRTGTNALLLSPPDSLPPSFGPGSCQRHLDHAAATGVHCELTEVPTLALDVDTPQDLDQLRAKLAGLRGRAAHTRGILGSFSERAR
ncbi:MAG: 2-phospho-L-lactate guanylyltransferase [Solirubrobacterales bacterium]|nr:2-phospho-L-lactate guanylyltransferase [Solirubrobacterales bacterium]